MDGQILRQQLDSRSIAIALAVSWIDRELGAGYPWPGNVRELEQCVRNVMIRGSYEPARSSDRSERPALSDALASCNLSLAELEAEYVQEVYRRTGSYQEAARHLGIDRRTVKAKLLRP